MAPSASKKRKRDNEGEDGRISFKLCALPDNQLGPILGELSLVSLSEVVAENKNLSPVGFPGVQPPANTPFRCYRLKATEGGPASNAEKEFAAQPTLVAAETDDVEFSSNSEADAGAGCTYAQLNLISLREPGH
jgi:hypothetical protein